MSARIGKAAVEKRNNSVRDRVRTQRGADFHVTSREREGGERGGGAEAPFPDSALRVNSLLLRRASTPEENGGYNPKPNDHEPKDDSTPSPCKPVCTTCQIPTATLLYSYISLDRWCDKTTWLTQPWPSPSLPRRQFRRAQPTRRLLPPQRPPRPASIPSFAGSSWTLSGSRAGSWGQVQCCR